MEEATPIGARVTAVCPECASGKHVNCTGEAWSDFLDGPVPCGCDHKDAA